ncbi:MAG: DNA polymerase III subunit delta' [Paracoccaceae bacterium]|nr:DNA polymerase III subunit delta' [Paracoccaceae bacterium]
MSESAVPEPDRVESAPHPRETFAFFGQARAEAEFLDAARGGKLHHAWLLTGPKGVGKATLAYRIARHLLSAPHENDGPGLFGEDPTPPTLETPADHPVSRRIAAMSEPGLMVIRRGLSDDGKRPRAQITVDEVRKLNGFFGLSSASGAKRVVIVDSADDMNVSAANALLKLLEEPPKDAVLLLVSHLPARLLPTIRSRCRTLRLNTLEPEDLSSAIQAAGVDFTDSPALSALSGGSVGAAIRLIEQDGPALYADIIETFGTCPNLDRTKALSIAERAAARGAEARLDSTIDLIDLALSRIARHGAGMALEAEAAPGEAVALERLAPTPEASRRWAALQQDARARIDHGRRVNVDTQSLLMDLFLKANETAARS